MSGLIELMLEEAEWIWLVQCVDAHVDLGIKMQVLDNFEHELKAHASLVPHSLPHHYQQKCVGV